MPRVVSRIGVNVAGMSPLKESGAFGRWVSTRRLGAGNRGGSSQLLTSGLSAFPDSRVWGLILADDELIDAPPNPRELPLWSRWFAFHLSPRREMRKRLCKVINGRIRIKRLPAR